MITPRSLSTEFLRVVEIMLQPDFKMLWQGRPKNKPLPDMKYYIFDSAKSFLAQQRFVKVGNFTGKDWTGML